MLALRAEPGSDTPHLAKVPVPEPGPFDVLVEVAAAGLAPGMLRLLARGAFKRLPTTLGHEGAGTVVAAGERVSTPVVGQRVRVHANLTCRACTYCRTDREMMCPEQAMIGHAAFSEGPTPLYDAYHDGCLAEYVRVPYWQVDPLPDAVGFDLGAKVHDLANAMRALKSAAPSPGATVVITAATGTMGTATIKLAPVFGVGRLVLVGRDAGRLDAVRHLAGDVPVETVPVTEETDLTARLRPLAPEAVIDFTPEGPVLTQAAAALATGGTLVHMGGNPAPLSLPARVWMAKCLRLVGTRSCTRTDALEVLALLDSGVLAADELITHRFPLSEARRALAATRNRAEPIWMAVVNP
ncbi:alcohol dehydrogenase catalytic domain-containing protein [Nonomuraea sp. NN258]|nr:alcohol dehydrogenase catalytic domain-containing protein [Nonomuraea antri]